MQVNPERECSDVASLYMTLKRFTRIKLIECLICSSYTMYIPVSVLDKAPQ